jgi:hypothetical protein
MHSQSMQHNEAGGHWVAASAPYGGGECLVLRLDGEEVRAVAPPGVALGAHESSDELFRWRVSRWRCGRLVGAPRCVSEAHVLALAPHSAAWVLAQVQELSSRVTAAREGTVWRGARHETLRLLLQAGPCCASPGMELALREELPRILRSWPSSRIASASTFSASLREYPADAPLRRVARAANRCPALDEFALELQAIELELGRERLMSAVVELTHARARSHSWRYTRWLAPTDTRDPLLQQLGLVFDVAPTSEAVQNALGVLRTRCEVGSADRVDAVVVAMLHARTHSVRWRVTWPLRRALAWRRIGFVRDVLREEIRPRTSARARRVEREGLARVA